MADETLKSKLGKPKEDEFVFGRDSLDTLLGKVNEAEKPSDMSKLIDYTIGLPSGLSKKDQTYVNDQKDLFKSQADRAQKLFDKNSESTEWAKIGELFGQALVQLAAGYQGLKSGVDLSSGLKAKTTDWESRLNRLQRELDAKLTRIDRSEANLIGEEANVINRVGRERDRQIQLAQGGIREQDAKKADDARKLAGESKEYDNNLAAAETNIERFRTTKDAMVNELRGYEEMLNDGRIDEDKYTMKVKTLMTKAAENLGMDPKELAAMEKAATDETSFLNDVGSFIGLTTKVEEPIPLSEQFEAIAVPEIDDQVKTALKALASPTITPEQKSKIRSTLKRYKVLR